MHTEGTCVCTINGGQCTNQAVQGDDYCRPCLYDFHKHATK